MSATRGGWTATEREALAELFLAGASHATMRTALGKSRMQIRSGLEKLRADGVDLPARSLGRPSTTTVEGGWGEEAALGSQRLLAALHAYFANHPEGRLAA